MVYIHGVIRNADVETAHRAIGRLQRLSELLEHRRVQLAAQVGLTEQQWRVLEEISTEHFMPSLFARAQDSSAAAVSKITRQLLDKALISVSVARDDGRKRHFELTSKGKAVMTTLRGQRADAIERIWLRVPQDELEAFSRVGGTLIEAIEAYAREKEPI